MSHVARMKESCRTYELVIHLRALTNPGCRPKAVTTVVVAHTIHNMGGCLRLVGSSELKVAFAEYSLLYMALSQKRRIT